jgi:hypothetical protein
MMTRTSARLLMAATLLIATFAPGRSARSDESLVWTGTTNGSMISLSYGSLDSSKQPIFLLSCVNGMSVATLDVFGTIAGAKAGDPLTIELSAGDAQSPLKGEASIDDQTGAMFAEASDFELGPVLTVLRSTGPVTVKTGETSQTLPEQGRAAAVDKFSQACEMA